MATQFIKHFLNLLNDKVFISSIDYIDFKCRYISIRRDFFNLCFAMANTREQIFRPAAFARILKELFITRFSQISTSVLTSYMKGFVRNSYIDFVNVANYYVDVICTSNNREKFFKNYLNKRNFRFYEKKGKRYYLYCIKHTPIPFDELVKEEPNEDDSLYLASQDYIKIHEEGDSDDDTDYDYNEQQEFSNDDQQQEEQQSEIQETNQIVDEDSEDNQFYDELFEEFEFEKQKDEFINDAPEAIDLEQLKKDYYMMQSEFQVMGIFTFEDYLKFRDQPDDFTSDEEDQRYDYDGELQLSGTYSGELPDYLYKDQLRKEIYDLNQQSLDIEKQRISNFKQNDEISNYDTSQGFENLDNLFKLSAQKDVKLKQNSDNIKANINQSTSRLFK